MDEFTLGAIDSLAYQVERGVKPAAEVTVKADKAMEYVSFLHRNRKVICCIEEIDGVFATIWILSDPRMWDVVLQRPKNPQTAADHWYLGALFGYSGTAILDFVERGANELQTVFIMNLLSYQDVENYLQNKQVYFKKEIATSDLKTLAESGKVHNVGKVELKRLNATVVALYIQVNGIEIPLYEYKTDLELFAWIKQNFIPVCELINSYQSNGL